MAEKIRDLNECMLTLAKHVEGVEYKPVAMGSWVGVLAPDTVDEEISEMMSLEDNEQPNGDESTLAALDKLACLSEKERKKAFEFINGL